MKKIFLVDTCVWVDDNDVMHKLGDNKIVVPFRVLEELDKLKDSRESKGEGARSAIRAIYAIGENGKLRDGVELSNGATFQIDVRDPHKVKLPFPLDLSDSDNVILAVAYGIKKQFPKQEVILITNDINLRVKSEALDIPTERYENRSVKKVDGIFSSFKKIEVSSDDVDDFMDDGYMNLPNEVSCLANDSVLIRAYNSKQSAMGRYCPIKKKIVRLEYEDQEICGIKAKSLEQRFAFNLLLNSKIRLVSLIGSAGTGKTLLAIASGIHSVLHKKEYKRLIIIRPVVPISAAQSLGFLPGSIEEKTRPFEQPIRDALEVIVGHDDPQEVDSLIQRKVIEFMPLTYIRGSTFLNSFIILDESQNTSGREMKTLLSRMGESSKVVLTGDNNQIDVPYLDSNLNGLCLAASKFRGQPIAGCAILTKCERGSLAQLAAELL